MDASQLRFSNNLVFTAVMQNSPDLCKRFIERILGIEIDLVLRISTEDTVSGGTFKSPRLDVTMWSEGRIIDVEMQCTDSPYLGRRMRFYQAQLDSRALKRGEAYSDLADC